MADVAHHGPLGIQLPPALVGPPRRHGRFQLNLVLVRGVDDLFVQKHLCVGSGRRGAWGVGRPKQMNGVECGCDGWRGVEATRVRRWLSDHHKN